MTTDPCRMTSMWVWYLADPTAPVRIGRVSLIPARTRCAFDYDAAWTASGFALSPDMPMTSRSPILPPPDFTAPGALEDAMPDRWGQSTIRLIDRPQRLSPLDYLYFAGDRRSGALGISTDPETYRPYPNDPLLTGASLEEANEIIHRVINREPLNERERHLLRTSKSMGGAHPKMLVAIDGYEWIAKFPKGDSVDLPLVEHATTVLAASVGIRTPESRRHRITIGHIVLTKRFDRSVSGRLHTLTARTMLATEGGESYVSIANVIRKHAAADTLQLQQRELFRRMTFNILMDNTDDHAKNHAFIRLASGHFELSPAYDLLPQMSGLGKQAIPVSLRSAEDDFASAIACSADFGMAAAEAVESWRDVARGVARWKEVFNGLGVTSGDIAYLSDFIDSDDKLFLRSERVVDTIPASRKDDR